MKRPSHEEVEELFDMVEAAVAEAGAAATTDEPEDDDRRILSDG